MSTEGVSPIRQRRATRACDFCHKRGIKCRPGPTASIPAATISGTPAPPSCLTCKEYSVECTQLRALAKRGTKVGSRKRPRYESSASQPLAIQQEVASPYEIPSDVRSNLMKSLVDVYFDTIYPIYPFFDEESFLEKFENSSLVQDPASYASLMAVCAWSARHVQEGAVFTPDIAPSSDELTANHFLKSALDAIPEDLDKCRGFEYLRAIGLICHVAEQTNNIALLHQFTGKYHGLVALQAFHDEARWSGDITIRERNVRRLVFWSMYRLEVHTGAVMGHMIRCPERQCCVAYPTVFTSSDGRETTDSSGSSHWLVGWNHVTDLYRILEHVLTHFKYERASPTAIRPAQLWPYISRESVLEQMRSLEGSLPQNFEAAPKSLSSTTDARRGFQVANIVATAQLVKMVSFTAEDATFPAACAAAHGFLEAVSSIPFAFFRAIGLPMLQELSGIGHMLSSVIGTKLSESDYQQLRVLILRMADFLKSLDGHLRSAGTAGERLEAHVQRIDELVSVRRAERLQQEQQDYIDAAVVNTDEEDFFSADLLDYLENFPWMSDEAEDISMDTFQFGVGT